MTPDVMSGEVCSERFITAGDCARFYAERCRYLVTDARG